MSITPKYDVGKMKKLKADGKSFTEIAAEMNCSVDTVKYHLIKNRKGQILKQCEKDKFKYCLALKRRQFLGRKKGVHRFSLEELKSKIGNDPRCYLTNESIDLSRPDTYSLDHKLSIARGGGSELENAELIKLDVNLAKHTKTVEEFLDLCRRVLINNGYDVTKK